MGTVALPQKPVSEIVKRLRNMSGMLTMGEKIAFGSDAALMEEAAAHIATLEDRVSAIGKERDEARQIVVNAWNAFVGNEPFAVDYEDAQYLAVAADGTLAEQISTLSGQRDAAEAQLSRLQSDCDEMRKAMEKAHE